MQVKDHNKMLSKQFLLGAHQDDRMDHHTAFPPPVKSRQLRPTLAERYNDELEGLVDLRVPFDRGKYKDGLRKIHQQEARRSIDNNRPALLVSLDPNNSLAVDSSEKQLPRTARSTLAQLRSGYSKFLGSYKSRVDPTASDQCPDCEGTPHDVHHLFRCPNNPAPPDLGVASLWTNPLGVAEFLQLGGLEDEDVTTTT